MINRKIKSFLPMLFLLVIVSYWTISRSYEPHDVVSVFPLEHYSQNISTYIPSNQQDREPLLSPSKQDKALKFYYDKYYGERSPWSKSYVQKIFDETGAENIYNYQMQVLDEFSNDHKPAEQIGYSENFRPHTKQWIVDIANLVQASQFKTLHYDADRQAITIHNLLVRSLPTDDVHFYDYKIAGQGYPFDNLQVSSIWIGTPVYVVGQSRDHAWSLIIGPDFTGWVKSNGLARVSSDFIKAWRDTSQKNLAAITQTQTSLIANDGVFLETAYIGTLLPVASQEQDDLVLYVPVADANNHAQVKQVRLNRSNAAIVPLPFNREQLTRMMQSLLGRPYGWGNSYFYNDCSAELKNLFAPFGIWLPRNSQEQARDGKMIDLSHLTPTKRIAFLKNHGKAFSTIVYIGQHVFLYIGSYQDPQSHAEWLMTYQNVWGLKPNPPNRRAVIGKSVLLPLLQRFPEDPSLESQAAKPFFQVTYLAQ